MTLLQIATNVLSGCKSSEFPSTIIGNSNDTAQLVFNAIRRGAKDVFKSYAENASSWQILTQSYSFETVIDQQAYSLPSDIFNSTIINDSGWNATTRFKLIGPVSPAQWQLDVNLLINPTITQQFIVRGNQFLIYQTPSAVQTINYLYLSQNYIYAEDGSTQSEWEADTDYPILDAYAIELQATWRYLKQLGRTHLEEQKEANDYLSNIIGLDGGRRTIFVNQQFLPPIYPLGSWLGPITK